MESMFSFADQVLSVSDITNLIKEMLETSLKSVTIEGEISNFKPSASGHVYFTLKDNDAQISAVIFKSSVYKLKFNPKDGNKVRCTGNITVYKQRGNYQIIVSSMEQVGAGDILQMLELRKQKLAKEGYFDSDKKKQLPLFPKTVGIVTSPTGAAIRDILQITKRRNKNIDIIIFPTIVQGEYAASSICRMIHLANFYEMCDVLIIGRGGGALEDLLPFSDENVVKAVFNSNIPTISAVGHEIDWALCDYAADKRAATPSAAAEIAIPIKSEIIDKLNTYKRTLFSEITNKVENKRLLIKSFNPDILHMRFRTIQQPLLTRFDNSKKLLQENIIQRIKDLRIEIQNKKNLLESSSPDAILKRGYSIIYQKKTGKVITDEKDLLINDEINIRFAQGQREAIIKN